MHETQIEGRVWKFGDNVSGDDGIIDFSVMKDITKPFDEKELGELAFKHVRDDFQANVREGDIIVGGKNFAKDNHPQCGVAIRGAGIRAIVCESTDTGFVRKSLNVGLPVLICPGISKIVNEWERLRVDFASGEARNLDTQAVCNTRPYSNRMLEILQSGSLVQFLKNRVGDQAGSVV